MKLELENGTVVSFDVKDMAFLRKIKKEVQKTETFLLMKERYPKMPDVYLHIVVDEVMRLNDKIEGNEVLSDITVENALQNTNLEGTFTSGYLSAEEMEYVVTEDYHNDSVELNHCFFENIPVKDTVLHILESYSSIQNSLNGDYICLIRDAVLKKDGDDIILENGQLLTLDMIQNGDELIQTDDISAVIDSMGFMYDSVDFPDKSGTLVMPGDVLYRLDDYDFENGLSKTGTLEARVTHGIVLDFLF